MPSYREKGSVTFILLLFAFFLTFLLFVPLPYYHHDQGWFMGPSIAARLMDNSSQAAPIDAIVKSYVGSTLQSPFDISCETDLDCQVINIRNQCKSYCADSGPDNEEIIETLQKQRVCDPAFWTPEITSCRCVLNKCLDIDY